MEIIKLLPEAEEGPCSPAFLYWQGPGWYAWELGSEARLHRIAPLEASLADADAKAKALGLWGGEDYLEHLEAPEIKDFERAEEAADE